MEKSEPGIKTSVASIEEPVQFADSTVEANVTLEFPSETPGYNIVPAKKPLKVHIQQMLINKFCYYLVCLIDNLLTRSHGGNWILCFSAPLSYQIATLRSCP